MQKNVGGTDRIARLVIGPILILAGVAGYAGLLALAVGPVPGALAAGVVLLVGAVLLVTGAVQQCPLNSVLGFNTYRRKTAGETEDRSGLNKN